MKNKQIEHKIDALLTEMTLVEKIGQLVQYSNGAELTGPRGEPVDIEQLVREGRVGTVLNYTGVAATKNIQEIALKGSRLGIPLMLGYDVIHGYKTSFPVPLAQAASWNTEYIEQAESIAAREATAAGVNWAFTPMVDIARDPRWGRMIEGSGEDAYLGSLIASARIRGLQGDDMSAPDKLMACVKHYVGYGAAQAGRDYHATDIPERILRDVYLPPFEAAVQAGVGSIMPAFNEIDGVPMTANKELIRDVLMGEMGFDGCVVSDWTAVHELVNHGVAADDKQAAALALNAGVDIDMCSSSYAKYLEELVNEGTVAEDTVDDAVRRVLRAKYRLNLFDKPHKNIDEQLEARTLEAHEHFEFAKQFAKECIVLLKNEDNVLPLSKSVQSIAVIGPFADAKQEVCGAWRAQADVAKATTVLEGIRSKLGGHAAVRYAKGCLTHTAEVDVEMLNEALDAVRQSEVAVVVLGEYADESGEAASLTSLNLAGGQRMLLGAIRAIGKPVVLVVQTGRPFTIEWECSVVPAVLQAWHLGSRAGAATADVLFGDSNPCGKLPVTMPRSIGQIPIFYNCKPTGRPFEAGNKYTSRYLDCANTPLYPFGYGLSYSTFKYSPIRLSAEKMCRVGSITVSVDVQNTSTCAGKEVVQLYIHDVVASLSRPVKELKGFSKINLQGGESRTVSFEITQEMLSFVGADMRRTVEAGEFTVFIGGDSSDCQTARFWLE